MEGVSLSALSEPVMSIGSALAPVIKKLRAERRAANSARIDTQLLEGLLDDTLSRLHNIAAHDVWWRDLLRRAASQYVRPEYLEKPAIREWLSESAVRDDLKLLTRIQLLPGASEEASIKARLADRYSAYTGEAAPLAAGPVDAIVNILLAGALAPASKSDLLLAGLVRVCQADDSSALTDRGKAGSAYGRPHRGRCAYRESYVRVNSDPPSPIAAASQFTGRNCCFG